MSRAAWLGGVALAAASIACADQVKRSPQADTSLFELSPANNLGAVAALPVGTINRGTRCRMLLRFDVAGALPTGALVTAVSLDLTVTASGGVDSDFELRRVLQSWTEGTQGATSSTGGAADSGETTWLARAHPALRWTQPGGELGVDFAVAPSASRRLESPARYAFSGTTILVKDVQNWLDQPDSNFGWVLMSTEEGASNTAKRIAAREATDGVPVLTVDYVLPTPAPRIDRIEAVGNEVRLLFSIEAGKLYAVEFNEAIATTNWIVLSYAASKFWPTNWIATDSRLNSPHRFYRLAILGDID